MNNTQTLSPRPSIEEALEFLGMSNMDKAMGIRALLRISEYENLPLYFDEPLICAPTSVKYGDQYDDDGEFLETLLIDPNDTRELWSEHILANFQLHMPSNDSFDLIVNTIIHDGVPYHVLLPNGTVSEGESIGYEKFYFNPLYLNPALSGMDNNFRLFVNSKNQWSKVPTQFNTHSISFDTWQNHQNSSLSMLYSTGNEGESYLRTDRFHFGGSYRLFDVFPSPFAWQFGFHYQNISKRLDWSRMVFSDELDPYLGNVYTTSFIIPNSNRFNTSNLALGTVITYHIKRGSKSKRFHLPIDLDVELGLAVHDFVQRANSFVDNETYKSNRKYTYHGSMIWPFSGKLSGGVNTQLYL